MEEFTYELPDNKSFFKTVMTIMSRDPFYKVYYDSLKKGYCEINASSQYSENRWNAMYTSVNFYLPLENYTSIDQIGMTMLKKYLLKICKTAMPPSAGYDVMEINIVPTIPSENNSEDLDEILNEMTEDLNDISLIHLSEDLQEKGKEMADIYVQLYVFENYLRNFIDKIFSSEIGEDYMEKISIPSDLRKGIAIRKNEEQTNKWMPLRGDNDLYYIDFNDLVLLIVNNWTYFKKYCISQEWIKVKINELYNVRCHIAHNSFVGDDERKLVSVNVKQILKQLNSFK